MFLRVRDFGSAHLREFPEGTEAGKAFEAVAAAASKIEAHAAVVAQVRAESKRVKTRAREEIIDRLVLIARTSPEAAGDGADIQPSPKLRLKTDVAVLNAARGFLNQGQAAMDRLVPLGAAPTLFTELQEQVGRFEEAARAMGRLKALIATERAGIRTAIQAGRRAVRRLNVIVINTFAPDPVQLAEWKRVRRVYPKPKASGAGKASAAPTVVTTAGRAAGQPETGAATQLADAPADGTLRRAS